MAWKIRKWIVVHIHYINLCIIIFVIGLGYYPFLLTILGYDKSTVIRQPLEPACQKKCAVGVPRSSVDKFGSSFDSTQVLFVHFSGYSLSLNSSDATDILDPLNLVWVENNEAPFLSFDLGFNVYSFTTLSRVLHHMKVKVEVVPINCLQNMNHSCVVANLARTFLRNVTKERGVLCYAVNDSNTVNYRCCKGNVETKQVECDIPAVVSTEMVGIFTAVTIAALIAFLCFPVIFNIVPDKKDSETLRSNTQIHNPLSHLVIYTVQALRHYSTEYYWFNVLRKFLIVLALPTLYYIDYGLQYHTMNYDIPKMFNDYVKNVWVVSTIASGTFWYKNIASNTSISGTVLIIYSVFVIVVSFFPRFERLDVRSVSWAEEIQFLLEKEKHIKVNWLEPCVWTKYFFYLLGSLFEEVKNREGSFISRIASLLGSLVLSLLSPVVTILFFIYYTVYVSPLGKVMRTFVYHGLLYWAERHKKLSSNFLCGLLPYVAFPLFSLVAFSPMFYRSLLLSARLIVYLWMGLVASKDYYFPRIAFYSVSLYYSWNCLSSVTSRYQILLKQTFEKCKEHQEKHPDGRKGLTFDEEGVPRISSKLFERVIGEILPRSEVYTIMILKLTIIILFLYLTFSSILVYGKSNLDESTKALALLLTALLPKMIELFGEGSSYRPLCEMENACRVEKIVKDFSSLINVTSSEDGTSMRHDEEQPPSNPPGDQPPTTSINYAMELHQLTSEECPVPKSGDSNKDKSRNSSEGNGRGDMEVVVIDQTPSTEETPLLEHQRKRDSNAKV